MRFTSRIVTLWFFGLLVVVNLLVFIIQTITPMAPVELWVIGAALLVNSVIFGIYWYGWEPARYILLIFTTLMVGLVLDPQQVPSALTVLPAALAGILAGPWWIIGSWGAIYLLMLVRSGGIGPYTEATTFLAALLPVGAILLGHLLARTAQRAAEENARQAREERARAESQAQELAEANRRQEEQLDEQRRLLSLVATLETPLVALAEGVMFAPLVGHLDSRRAEALTRRLLQEAQNRRVALVVIDIAGVPLVDTQVARSLVSAAQALRLLGCGVAISGISSSVALTLVQLGVSFSDIRTVRSPQEALALIDDGVD